MALPVIPAVSLLATFSRPFHDLVFYADFMLNWAHFWLPFGSLWLPFGTLWLTFGALWLPFGSLLVPLGSLLVPLGSLLVPLSLDFLIFGASWRHSSYLFIFLKKTVCKIIFLENWYCESDCCVIVIIGGTLSRTAPRRQSQAPWPWQSTIPRARSGPVASGNLD